MEQRGNTLQEQATYLDDSSETPGPIPIVHDPNVSLKSCGSLTRKVYDFPVLRGFEPQRAARLMPIIPQLSVLKAVAQS
jgi:hypothetical protein